MSLKRFISFSAPLMVMLFTFSIYISISKIVSNYEKSINNDYSIIIVSSTPIIKSKIHDIKDINVKKITHLEREKILKNLNEDMSSGTYDLLVKKLPYFYTISLDKFPTSNKLSYFKVELEKISGIKSVETFSKNHDNIYSLLLLIKTIVSSLFICIIIFAFLIMLDNVKIWFFEHSNRLSVIKLHGGSIFYGANPIIKIALISSIFSSVFIALCIYFLKENLDLFLQIEVMNIITSNLTAYTALEIVSLFALSLVLSFITVFGILLKHRIK